MKKIDYRTTPPKEAAQILIDRHGMRCAAGEAHQRAREAKRPEAVDFWNAVEAAAIELRRGKVPYRGGVTDLPCGARVWRATTTLAYRAGDTFPGGEDTLEVARLLGGILFCTRQDAHAFLEELKRRIPVKQPCGRPVYLCVSNRFQGNRYGTYGYLSIYHGQAVCKITLYRWSVSVLAHEYAHHMNRCLDPDTDYVNGGHTASFYKHLREAHRVSLEILGTTAGDEFRAYCELGSKEG